MGRVFPSGLGDWGSIPGRVIPKTQKIVLDMVWLDTQYYKDQGSSESVKGKKWPPHLNSGVVANEKGTFGLLSTTIANFTTLFICTKTLILP